MKFSLLVAAVAANQYDSMNEDELLVNLESTLSSALSSEARGDGDAAVAKTAAIKNIQKALTARILKRLDDGQPLVEVARKMKAIEGMQPQINDMERRLGIMQSVEPVLENAIKTLQKVVDVRGMGKKWASISMPNAVWITQILMQGQLRLSFDDSARLSLIWGETKCWNDEEVDLYLICI